MTYFELINDTDSLYKNPKLLSSLLSQIRELLIYIEPRIKTLVQDSDIKSKWINKIDNLKEDYKKIINK